MKIKEFTFKFINGSITVLAANCSRREKTLKKQEKEWDINLTI